MADNDPVRLEAFGPASKNIMATKEECEAAIRGDAVVRDVVTACAINAHPEILTYLSQAANLVARGANAPMCADALARVRIVLDKINQHIELHAEESVNATNTVRLLQMATHGGLQ